MTCWDFMCRTFAITFWERLSASWRPVTIPERAAVVYNGHSTRVLPFPISVDFEAISRRAEGKPCLERMESLRQELGLADKVMLFGIDRLDYTKGIPDRLRAADLFSSGTRSTSGS